MIHAVLVDSLQATQAIALNKEEYLKHLISVNKSARKGEDITVDIPDNFFASPAVATSKTPVPLSTITKGHPAPPAALAVMHELLGAYEVRTAFWHNSHDQWEY